MNVELLGDEDSPNISEYGMRLIKERRGGYSLVTFVTTKVLKVYHRETFDMSMQLIENKSNRKRKLYDVHEVVKVKAREIVGCHPHYSDMEGHEYGRDDLDHCDSNFGYEEDWLPIVIMPKDQIKETYSFTDVDSLKEIKNNLYFPVEVSNAFIDKKVCVKDCNCEDCNKDEDDE